MASEERRKELTNALNRLPADRARDLRARLERPEASPYCLGGDSQAGYVVAETVIATVQGHMFTKATFMDPDGPPGTRRYGYFAPEDCQDNYSSPRGDPFWVSERSWTGPRDPAVERDY
jgi:hypothetical protein